MHAERGGEGGGRPDGSGGSGSSGSGSSGSGRSGGGRSGSGRSGGSGASDSGGSGGRRSRGKRRGGGSQCHVPFRGCSGSGRRSRMYCRNGSKLHRPVVRTGGACRHLLQLGKVLPGWRYRWASGRRSIALSFGRALRPCNLRHKGRDAVRRHRRGQRVRLRAARRPLVATARLYPVSRGGRVDGCAVCYYRRGQRVRLRAARRPLVATASLHPVSRGCRVDGRAARARGHVAKQPSDLALCLLLHVCKPQSAHLC